MFNCFCIYKNHENSFYNKKQEKLLIENYEIFINPKVIEVSKEQESEYELCSSFRM